MALNTIDSLWAIQTAQGIFCLDGHPSGRIIWPLYRDAEKAQGVADSLKRRGKGPDNIPMFIGGIESVRQFIGHVPEDHIVVIVEGKDDITDQIEGLPHQILAELPAGDFYGFSYEETGEERFDPGDINITPGVHEALGARVGEVLQELM